MWKIVLPEPLLEDDLIGRVTDDQNTEVSGPVRLDEILSLQVIRHGYFHHKVSTGWAVCSNL